jgi:hypothetical protein
MPELRLVFLAPLAVLLASCAWSGPTAPEFTPPPNASRAEIMVGCLTELGWEGLEVDWDGGTDTSHIPDEQRDLYDADQARCAERYPYKPPTESDVRELYAAELENSSCLSDLGYDMPEPPSEQVFVDTFGTATQWFAMTSATLEAMDAATYESVFTACPPPSWKL